MVEQHGRGTANQSAWTDVGQQVGRRAGGAAEMQHFLQIDEGLPEASEASPVPLQNEGLRLLKRPV